MFDLSKIILIDHHVHSLLKDFHLLDEVGFRQAFSETSSMSMLQNHVQNTVSYMHMIKELGDFLDVQGESAIIELRSSLDPRDYVQLLFDNCSIGALIVDSGFGGDSMLSLERFTQLSGRDVRNCLRIEKMIEDGFKSATTLRELSDKMQSSIVERNEQRVVSLKTIAAYRGGLEIEMVTAEAARADFESAKKDAVRDKPLRIEARPFYHFLLAEAFEIAQKESIPVQIHCGIGDRDADLRNSNPLCFRSILEAKRFAKTNFVFLHCYPFVREAAFLASIYPNVYIDLSLALTLNSPQAGNLFADALSLAPFTKILIATDGHSVPESYWYGSHSARQGLSAALGFMYSNGFLQEEEALNVAAHLFHKNAQLLYKLDAF